MTTQALITAAAAKYGVDPSLALAVATKESGLNQAARGSSGEVGVYQLMPGTAADLGVNPYDLSSNIDGGVRYLAQLLGKYGDTGTALAAYNGGQGNMDRGTVSGAAWSYAQDILSKLGLTSSSSGTTDTWDDSMASDDASVSPAVIAAGAIGLGLLLYLVA